MCFVVSSLDIWAHLKQFGNQGLRYDSLLLPLALSSESGGRRGCVLFSDHLALQHGVSVLVYGRNHHSLE